MSVVKTKNTKVMGYTGEAGPYESSVEFHPAIGEKKAVTVVSHGLNNKPSVMLPLVKYLNEMGSDVYMLKLFGHRDDESGHTRITDNIWSDETLNAYHQARKLADKNGVALYFLGYSLGAMVGQYVIFNSKGKVKFDKQVLLAPATALRCRSGFLKITFILPGHWKLPSYTPEPYRANNGIQIDYYKILFRLKKKIKKAGFDHLNYPTLVIMDKKDELVSHGKLNSYITRFDLSKYKMVTLNPSMEGRTSKYHHLIVDETSMGPENWGLVKEEMGKFLFTP